MTLDMTLDMTKEISFQRFEKYQTKRTLQRVALPIGCALLALTTVALVFAGLHGALPPKTLNLSYILPFSALAVGFLLYVPYTGALTIKYFRRRGLIKGERLPAQLLAQIKEFTHFFGKKYTKNCYMKLRTKDFYVVAIKERTSGRIQYSKKEIAALDGYTIQLSKEQTNTLEENALDRGKTYRDL